MRLILVGQNNAMLTSLIPASDKIDSILINKTLNISCEPTQTMIDLVIIDLDNIDKEPVTAYKTAKDKLPDATVWAYYSQNRNSVKEKLLQIGFEKTLHPDSNIPEAINNFINN